TSGTPLDGSRETAAVSELPPPPPPPPGSGGPYGAARTPFERPQGDRATVPPLRPSPEPPDDSDDSDARDIDPDWERFKEYARTWYAPLTEEATWKSLGYLFATAGMSALVFALMAGAMATIFALHFIFVGLLLVVPFFAAVY